MEKGLSETSPTSLGFTPHASTSPNTSTLSLSDLDSEQQDAVTAVARAEIETGVHQLETLLESSIDNNFDRLEIYLLRNILTVPPGLERWIQLRHYDGLDLRSLEPQTNTNKQQQSPPSAEELIRKRRKLHETQKLNASLRAESAANTAMLDQLRALLSPPSTLDESAPKASNMSFLQHSSQLEALRGASGQAQNQPVTAQTQAALAQLPQLKTLVAQLRKAQAKGLGAPKRSEREQERAHYIDRGVNAAIGDNRGGASGLGPKVTRENVQGIEQIAKSFENDRAR